MPATATPAMQRVFQRADWMEHALCRRPDPELLERYAAPTMADLFHPSSGQNRRVADLKRLCEDCPVKQPCLDTALTDRSLGGIWAGTTRRERARLRRLLQTEEGTAS